MRIKKALFLAVFLSIYCIFILICIFKPPYMAANEDTALIEENNSNTIENFNNNESIASISTKTFIYEKYQNAKADVATPEDSQESLTLKAESETGLKLSDESLNEINETSDLIQELVPSDYSDIGISIANTYINIREKASTDSPVKGKLYRDGAAKILNTVGDWYYIESGNVKGYIKSKYLKTGIPTLDLIEKYGTLRITVNTDGLNVRKSPEIDSERIGVIYRNECYTVTGFLGEWVEIEVPDKNITGFVSKEYVNLLVDFKTAISINEEELNKSEQKEKNKYNTGLKNRDPLDYSKEDLKLLACLVYAEAGNQSYEGKLAVANVVINRVKSSKFPNTIKDVIYQPGQFTVVKNGSLAKQLKKYDNYSSKSQLQAIKAAKAALEGENNIGNRLYFNGYKASVKKGYHKNKNCIKIGDQLFW